MQWAVAHRVRLGGRSALAPRLVITDVPEELGRAALRSALASSTGTTGLGQHTTCEMRSPADYEALLAESAAKSADAGDAGVTRNGSRSPGT